MSTSDMLSMLSTCTSMPTGIGDPAWEQKRHEEQNSIFKGKTAALAGYRDYSIPTFTAVSPP